VAEITTVQPDHDTALIPQVGSALTEADLAMLDKAGIQPSTAIDLARWRRVTHAEARECCGIRYKSSHLEGIAIPYLDPTDNHVWTWRVRRDHPEVNIDGKPTAKYVSPPDRHRLYFAPGRSPAFADTSMLAIIVEAEKSVLSIMDAEATAKRPPAVVIGTGGCWGWRGVTGKTTAPDGSRVDEKGPLPDLDRVDWTGRDTIIVFDSNVSTNEKVQQARRDLAAELGRRGADVRVVDLPVEAGINGPDDYLGKHGATAFFALLDAAERLPGSERSIVPAPSAPMAVAREIVKHLYTNPDGFVLRDHRGDFYQWDGTCWPEVDRRDVRGAVYTFLEHTDFMHPKDGRTPFAPTRRKIDDVLDALRAVVILPSRLNAPTWTTTTSRICASEIVALANGLLHVPTRRLLPHTPTFFAHHALPFAFDAKAAAPSRWLAFLRELWPQDDSSITALQEVFGYLLGGDTRLQKMFLLVGPKRAGKGTIARVLTGLLGQHNVAGPTLAGLATNFGLSPLIGKPLAVISDARLSSRTDSKIVVERLLSISGEDSLQVDRKYREPWTGRLPSRFLICTNELPRLSDASGALASRFVVFVLTKSFYDAENPGLTDELLTESTAIFNWALEGLDRLTARGYFVNPEAGKDAIQQLEDLASPISAFVRDRCVVHANKQVDTDELWAAWKGWCDADNRPPGTKQVFGRDLRAAVPTVKRVRPRTDADRAYAYSGIGIRGPGNTAVDLGPLGPPPSDPAPGPNGPRTKAMYAEHADHPARSAAPSPNSARSQPTSDPAPVPEPATLDLFDDVPPMGADARRPVTEGEQSALRQQFAAIDELVIRAEPHGPSPLTIYSEPLDPPGGSQRDSKD
jgi:putative DNA primase/helicase